MKDKFFRRVALFVLFDETNKILLQHKASDAERLPNHWAFFGGGIEEGETPEQAVVREAEEELEIEFSPVELFKRYEFEFNSRLYEMHMFLEKLRYEIDDLKKQQQEGQGLGLFTIDEALELEMIEQDKRVLRDLKIFFETRSV